MLWRPNLETADFAFIDLYDYSCLNGWAMGNIAASAMNLAMFFRDLFAPPTAGHELVKPETAHKMVENIGPLAPFGGMRYGLGMFDM